MKNIDIIESAKKAHGSSICCHKEGGKRAA